LRKVDSCTTQVATRRHTRRRTPWITDSTPSALTHAARARRTPPTGVDTVFGTTSCPCGQGHGETVEHTFWKCDRSYLVWESITRFWRTATGEHGVTATDGRLVLFGDRSATWGSEADWAEWAGLEEPFAILHKPLFGTREPCYKPTFPRSYERSAWHLLHEHEAGLHDY
jgi:hypothetical protein